MVPHNRFDASNTSGTRQTNFRKNTCLCHKIRSQGSAFYILLSEVLLLVTELPRREDETRAVRSGKGEQAEGHEEGAPEVAVNTTGRGTAADGRQ